MEQRVARTAPGERTSGTYDPGDSIVDGDGEHDDQHPHQPERHRERERAQARARDRLGRRDPHRVGARYPDDVAVIVGDAAHHLRASSGRRPSPTPAPSAPRASTEGARVAMLVPNVADFARVYYATLALGAVVVPVHALLKRHEIEYVLRDSGATLLVCAAPLLAEGAAGAAAGGGRRRDRARASGDRRRPRGPDPTGSRRSPQAAEPLDTYVPRDPFDTATILYTSGTTGQPKGAEGSHFALLEQVNTNLMSTFDMHRGRRAARRPAAVPHLRADLHDEHRVPRRRDDRHAAEVRRRRGARRPWSSTAARSSWACRRCTWRCSTPRRGTEARPPLRYAISGGASLPLAVLERFQQVVRRRRSTRATG